MGRQEQILGTRLNLGSGVYIIEGFDNLDKIEGWLFEEGLPEYADGSVEAITVSTALIYVGVEHWTFIFSEFARVLEPGGVVRVMEADTSHPESKQFGLQDPDGRAMTDPGMVIGYMQRGGWSRNGCTPTRPCSRTGH